MINAALWQGQSRMSLCRVRAAPPETEGFDQLGIDCRTPADTRRRPERIAVTGRHQRKYGSGSIPLQFRCNFPCYSAAAPLGNFGSNQLISLNMLYREGTRLQGRS